VEAVKGEVVKGLKELEVVEKELKKVLEAKGQEEKELEVKKQEGMKKQQDMRKQLEEEIFKYKSEILSRSASLATTSTKDIARWIQDVNGKMAEFTERRQALGDTDSAMTGLDGMIADLVTEKNKFLEAHKNKSSLENWEKALAQLLSEINQRSVSAEEILKSASVDQAEVMQKILTDLSGGGDDFTKRANELVSNSPPAIPKMRHKELLDKVEALKTIKEQLINQLETYQRQILADREKAEQLFVEANRIYESLAPEIDKGFQKMKTDAAAVNPAVLLAQAQGGSKLAQQWDKDAESFMDSKDAKVTEIRQKLKELAQNLNGKTSSVLEALEDFKKQTEAQQSQAAREKEETRARAVFEQFNREYFRIQELRSTVNMKDPDDIEKFVKNLREMGESATQEMQKLPSQSDSQVIAAMKDQLSSLLQEIQNRDKELMLIVSSIRSTRNQQLEEQRLAKQLYIKVEDRLAEIDPLISSLESRKLDELERFSKIISSQRIIYLEEMKKLTNTSNSVVVSFLIEKLQQMLDKMGEYETRIDKRRQTLTAPAAVSNQQTVSVPQ